MSHSPAIHDSVSALHPWRVWGLLVGFGLLVRMVALAALYKATGGREFADDFLYYEFFLRHPFALITGDQVSTVPDTAIYSPMVPLQVWFPGKWLGDLFGIFIGQRLSMIAYDMVTIGVTAWAMIGCAPARWNKKTWLAALLLMCMPAAIGAACLWGQEDTIAGTWTAFALLALIRGHPTIAALFGAFGLFTHKLFALLLSAAIWASSPGSRLKIAVLTAVITSMFATFLLYRWGQTGLVFGGYAYNAVYNSPSPWALIHRFVGDSVSFSSIRPFVLGITAVSLLAITLMLHRRDVSPEASVVATHCTFFVVFLGVQPEHHQWFMPFLMYFAWRQWLQGRWLTLVAAWMFSAAAYAFKISYGLQNRESLSSSGKMVFRSWIGEAGDHVLPTMQLGAHLLTLSIGILLIVQAFRSGTNKPRPAAAVS